MEQEDSFSRGDRIIRSMLVDLAAQNEVSFRGVELVEPRSGIYVYRLRGTRMVIALRAREIRYAADPDTLARFITPRLRAMFENLWWSQALILMGLRNQPP